MMELSDSSPAPDPSIVVDTSQRRCRHQQVPLCLVGAAVAICPALRGGSRAFRASRNTYQRRHGVYVGAHQFTTRRRVAEFRRLGRGRPCLIWQKKVRGRGTRGDLAVQVQRRGSRSPRAATHRAGFKINAIFPGQARSNQCNSPHNQIPNQRASSSRPAQCSEQWCDLQPDWGGVMEVLAAKQLKMFESG